MSEPNSATHTADGDPRCLYCGNPMMGGDLFTPPGGYSPAQPPLHTGCLIPFRALVERLRYWNRVRFAAEILREPTDDE